MLDRNWFKGGKHKAEYVPSNVAFTVVALSSLIWAGVFSYVHWVKLNLDNWNNRVVLKQYGKELACIFCLLILLKISKVDKDESVAAL